MSATFELEGFEPISRLGGGGFGDVWLARQTNVDRHVAIKVGHSAIQDETIRLRFDRECKALGRLSGHPNIVDVYTAGSLADGRPYLVLEYISGGTLWQRLKKEPLTEEELVAIGSQLAGALNEAHSSGVLHRDLKPENILIRSTGEAVLGDFGIARLHDGANTTSAAITASVAYAAPEILSGKRATVASDLYGIGVCLLAAVFRSVPFVQKSDESIHPIINRVLSEEHPNIRRHGISEGLAAVIDSLLAKDPATRPTSAAEVVRKFEALRPEAAATATPSGATQVVAGITPAAPAAPARPPVGQPPAAPKAEDAMPGPYAQQIDRAATGQPAPADPATGIPQPTGTGPVDPVVPPPQKVRSPASNARMFVLAYVATLVIGGLALLLFTQLGGDDDQGVETSAQQSTSTTTTVAAPATQPDADAATSDPDVERDLTIPLEPTDVSFGAEAESSDQSPGPGAPTLCGNEPAIDGLIDWAGNVIRADPSILYQVMSRFENPEQATAYLDAYADTRDCASWTVTGTETGVSDVIYEAEEVQPVSVGEETKVFEITGEHDGAVGIYARVLLIRSGSEVLGLSLSTSSLEQLDELESLASVAADRLDYETS